MKVSGCVLVDEGFLDEGSKRMAGQHFVVAAFVILAS